MPDRYSVYRKSLLDMSPRTLRRDDHLMVDPTDDLDRPFTLNASVGYGPRANRREDVFLIESALKRIGHLKSGSSPTGHMSRLFDGAVRSFQNDNDLKEDGLLNPGGPTVKSLAGRFGQSSPKPVRSPLSDRSPLPKVSAEAFSNNGRSVEHLMSTLDDGSFPALLSDAFNMNEKGQGEVADFFVQLRERDPERAKIMRDKTVPNLRAEQVDAFDQLIDDLATGRAEEAEKWARQNLGEEDEDDNGERIEPPSEEPKPEPEEEEEEEEKPSPDENDDDKPGKPNCDAIKALIGNLKISRDDVNKEINRVGVRITETEERVKKAEQDLVFIGGKAGLSGKGIADAILSGTVWKMLGSAASVGKSAQDILSAYTELNMAKMDLQGHQDQLAKYQDRVDSYNDRITSAQSDLQKCVKSSA